MTRIDPGRVVRLNDLLGMPVEGADGRKLGHVNDVRPASETSVETDSRSSSEPTGGCTDPNAAPIESSAVSLAVMVSSAYGVNIRSSSRACTVIRAVSTSLVAASTVMDALPR
jgi:hypothetical protein